MPRYPDEALRAKVAALQPELEVILEECGDILEAWIRGDASLDDHTLKELAKLGHPYRQAKGETIGQVRAGKPPDLTVKWRGGRISKAGKWVAGIYRAARAVREGTLGHDIKLVHEQSKHLQDAIRRETFSTPDQFILVVIYVDVNVAPYIGYVIKGTSKMLPRDFIGIAAVRARSALFRHLRLRLNGLLGR